MKKMQCEVCGSNEIKKVADGIFECQSCGVQYSTNDVKRLLVEIDHTKEVQNYIKRGTQFEKNGESEKAKEYYNRALDIDAENESAQEGLDRILEQQSWNDYYIIEADVDPKENVKDFLKQLATTKNIACDIYKHIKIDSVIEKYTTAVFVKQKCEYNWSATACNKYYENQTVYKEKYNSDLKRYVKEPVTEKVEKISRTPVSGREIYDNDGFALASNAVRNECNSKAELLSDLIQNFETLQDNKYADYNVRNIDKNKLSQENGCYRYGEIQLDIDFDQSICRTKEREILNSGDKKASSMIQNHIDADFVENYHCVRSVISNSVARIFIPVQIINYTYKGKKYTAVSDLLSKTSSIPTIYPCDVELSEKKSTLTTDNANIQKTSGLAKAGWACFIIGLLIGVIGVNISEGIGIFGLILFAFSYFLLVPSFIQKSKLKKKYAEESERFKIELYYPRKKYLSNSYNTFFEKYESPFSLEGIQSSINNNTIEISISDEVAYSGEIINFSNLSESDIDTETNLVSENHNRLSEAKKKRTLPICLMVGGFVFMELGMVLVASEAALGLGCFIMISGFACFAIIGPIMLEKVNKEINAINLEIKKANEKWINE